MFIHKRLREVMFRRVSGEFVQPGGVCESVPRRAAGRRRRGAVLQRPEPRPLPLLPTVLHVYVAAGARDWLCPGGGAPSSTFPVSFQWLAASQTHGDRRAARESEGWRKHSQRGSLTPTVNVTLTCPCRHHPGCWWRASGGHRPPLPPPPSLCYSQTAELCSSRCPDGLHTQI